MRSVKSFDTPCVRMAGVPMAANLPEGWAGSVQARRTGVGWAA